jgi:hypothetical protein
MKQVVPGRFRKIVTLDPRFREDDNILTLSLRAIETGGRKARQSHWLFSLIFGIASLLFVGYGFTPAITPPHLDSGSSLALNWIRGRN